MTRVDAGDFHRARIELGSRKRLDMRGDDGLGVDEAVIAHAHDDRRDFEQRVALAIEAAGLDVDDDRQEAAEALGHAR